MAYNGSGTFLINTAGQPVVSGTVISSTAFNALTADLATGLSTAITKDGQTTVTANIPMSTYKFTGLGVGSAATDSVNLSQVQSTVSKLLNTITGTNTITATASPTLSAYAAGQMFYFVAAGDNTTAVTLNIDGLGAKAVTRDGSTALISGDIKSGEVVVVVYDGTRFQVVSQVNSAGDATFANVSITSALNVGGVSTFTGLITANGGLNGAHNGTVGATTPNTGSFTTLTTSSTVTLNGGTANGVLYLNGSKVATSGSALVFNGSDLTVGGTAVNGKLNLIQSLSGASNAAGIWLSDNATTSMYLNNTSSGVSSIWTSGSLAFGVANGTFAEAMRLNASGNLGIGTTSPTSKLQVAGAVAAGNDGSAVSYYYTGGMAIRGSSAGALFIDTAASGGTDIIFRPAVTERMRLDSSGNLGIGTASPAYRLDVQHTTNGIGMRLRNTSTGVELATRTDATTSGIDAGNAPNGMTFSLNTVEGMRLTSTGLGIGTASPGYRLHVAQASGNDIGFFGTSAGGGGRIVFSDGNSGTAASVPRIGANANDLLFYTNISGNSATERARITSGGEVYIAGTTDQGAYNLQVNGTGVWGAGAYVNGSDARLKDNIQSLDAALDVVKAMRPVTFQYKADYSKDQSVQPGFIAQELQEAMAGKPYLDGIVQSGPEYLNVAYQNIIPILVKAIQELKAELDALKGAK